MTLRLHGWKFRISHRAIRPPMSDHRQQIILAHAGRRVPRYTSYPTAPHFDPAVNAKIYRAWLAALPETAPTSLYLHVPFCRSLCWYCGCHTRATRRAEPVARYLDMLDCEIDLLADALPGRMPLVNIHWGGGSPSLVPPDRFRSLMAKIRKRFDLSPDAEISVEIDPRTLELPFVDAMSASGVTRVSMGIQTFDPRIQAAINRVQSFESVVGTVEMLRTADIVRLNMDLLYGLPHQSVDSAAETAGLVAWLAPDRVSVFGYAHVPHMMKHQRLIDEAALPGPTARLAQADAIADTLHAADYVAIGLDHYAHRQDTLALAQRTGRLHRNFQGYTDDPAEVLLGVGASAIGELPQGYVQNVADIRRWHADLADGRLPVARGITLTPDDRLRRAIIERLMCDLAVDLDAVADVYALPVPIADLSQLEELGVVRRSGNRITIDETFRPLARVVAAAFDAWLADSMARHAIAV